MPLILYVEDNGSEFMLLQKAMKDFGWMVERAKDYPDAIAYLEKKAPDVVLLDRILPDPETGVESIQVGDRLLEVIVARWRYICPIMLTHTRDLEGVQRTTRYGAYRYFTKDVPHEQLDRACRNVMRMQLVKRARHALLSLESVGEVVSEVGRLIGKLIDVSYYFRHFQIGPGGSLLLCGPEPDCKESRLLSLDGYRFATMLPCAEEVLETRQFRLALKSEDIRRGGSLLPQAGSQLIVPVLAPELSDQPARSRTIALLWLESIQEEAFSREDADVLLALADYVGDTHAKSIRLLKLGAEVQDDEREGLLLEVAHEICNPLQTAQSNLDLLIARSKREETITPGELAKRLSSLLASMEDAIQAAAGLRYDVGDRELELEDLDLAGLAREMVGTFEGRFNQADCQLHLDFEEVLPEVRLDRRAMREVLRCLLENAVEAVEEKRVRTGERDQPGDILITLCSDPTGKHDVLLSITDSGCGIEMKHLPKLFNRYFTTKPESTNRGRRGLGLSQVKRFLDRVHGQIEAMNAPKGGAEFCLLFPAAGSSR
jgi:signal transduction histidine kinase